MTAADPRPSREAGLTLIELLVALVLLGMLFGLLQQGFALGHRVWERAGARGAATLGGVEAVQALLRERLATLNPAWSFLNEGEVVFEGDPAGMMFEARPPDVMAPATFFRFALAATAAGTLELAWRPDTDRSPLAPWARTSLMGGIAGLEIAYFGPTRRDPVPRWRDGWRREPRPPHLVRVRVRFPPGDRRRWPDLIMEPRAEVDSLCDWDASTRRCLRRG